MSLDKSIKNGREHRKPYRKAKAVDRTCRNHGTCAYCKANRLYSARKTLLEVAEKFQEYEK
ncbi:MAG: hypothetical protein NC177_07660 [Ruminococcus flavefaciens]|nr:hypothetical protein [Ruminococcus flavefaciens]